MAKRKRKGDTSNPGKQHQVLMLYSELPTDAQKLKNGHILYQDKVCASKVDVLRFFKDNFGITITKSILLTLYNRSVNKYKNLDREADGKKFREICETAFTKYSVAPIPGLPSVPQVSSSRSLDFESFFHEEGTSDTQPHPETPLPSAPKSPLLTSASIRSLKRKGLLTPLKKKILERGDKMRKGVRTLKRTVLVLKAKLSSKKFKQNRYLQRQIGRLYERLRIKDEKLRQKDKELHEIKNGVVEVHVQKQLRNAKRTIRRLKLQHKSCVSKVKFQKVMAENKEVKKRLKEKETAEFVIQDRILQLEDELNSLSNDENVDCREDGRNISCKARLLVDFMLDCGVPTKRVPFLIEKVGWWFGFKLNNIPQRSTVENIARELGVVSDLMVAEIAVTSPNITIGFDATTQEGIHVNEIHLSTSEKDSVVMALDEMPGGTAIDYTSHITRSVKRLADIHSFIYDSNSVEVEKQIQQNIKNSMTDRCPVNNSTIQSLEEKWETNINQLNCNLHPLETITRECKKVLKKHEQENKFPSGQCYGTDCLAGNLVLKSNQLRYKDGAGDPRLFKCSLQKADLPNNLLPRFRGARMHITHQISRVLLEHNVFFTKLFADKQLKSSQLRSAVQTDFSRPEIKIELQVLGIIGRAITGPWMKRFYNDEQSELHHFNVFELVKTAIVNIQQWSEQPMLVLNANGDCFGDKMVMDDCLSTIPANRNLFTLMLKNCFEQTVEVLNRQYSNYFTLDVNEKLKKETASAKVHNIYAEQIMGMFSAIKRLKTNASVDYISCIIRARKNQTVNYLMSLREEERELLMTKAKNFAKKDRKLKRKTQKALEKEILVRYEMKVQKGIDADHKRLVNQLKKGTKTTLDFPDHKEIMNIIIEGKLIGEIIGHTFYDENDKKPVMYLGKVESFNMKKEQYVIAYWQPHENETYEEDAVDEKQSVYALAVDFFYGDLAIE